MSKHKNNQGRNQCTLYIDGMHCSSCELIIEKKLIKQDHIKSVDVSRKNNTVNISYNSSQKVDTNELDKQFKDLGYKFSNHPFKYKPTGLWSINKNGEKKINKIFVKKFFKSFAVAFGLLIVFYIVESLQLGRFVSVDAKSSLIAFFLLGLVAGFSSCAALVGGLLLSMIKQWHEVYIDDEKQKSQPHILFHIGRLVSFFVLGGILGLLGDKISFNNTAVYATLVILVSIVMLLLALQMIDIEWARRLQIRIPKFISRFAANEEKIQGKYMPFVTGVLTFFLPCGFTLIAQGIALTTGSFLRGGLIMLLFALGTLPILLGISFTGLKFTKKPHLTAKFSYIAGIIIIFFAFYNINGQLNVLGFKSLSDINLGSNSSQYDSSEGVILFGPDKGKKISELQGSNKIVDNKGMQVLSFTAQGFEYVPTGPTTLKAGVPTKMVVQDNGILGCGAYIASRGLFNGFVALRPGENVIDLGIPKKGTYKVTCSMGMVPPVTVRFQ